MEDLDMRETERRQEDELVLENLEKAPVANDCDVQVATLFCDGLDTQVFLSSGLVGKTPGSMSERILLEDSFLTELESTTPRPATNDGSVVGRQRASSTGLVSTHSSTNSVLHLAIGGEQDATLEPASVVQPRASESIAAGMSGGLVVEGATGGQHQCAGTGLVSARPSTNSVLHLAIGGGQDTTLEPASVVQPGASTGVAVMREGLVVEGGRPGKQCADGTGLESARPSTNLAIGGGQDTTLEPAGVVQPGASTGVAGMSEGLVVDGATGRQQAGTGTGRGGQGQDRSGAATHAGDDGSTESDGEVSRHHQTED